MAPLNFNLSGYLFKAGIDPLQIAFDVALDALDGSVERSMAEAEAYMHRLQQGGDREGEWDEDGFPIWERQQLLEMEIAQTRDAQTALCKAFALAVYHQWERSIQLLADAGSNSKHPALVRAAEAEGFPLHPKLSALRDLANTLKHNSERYGKNLTDSWPEVFVSDFEFDPEKPPENWHELIQLQPCHVREAFTIALGSGPQTSP